MDSTNKKRAMISVKDFKTIIPYLEDHFKIYKVVLANTRFALYKSDTKELTSFNILNLDTLNDEDQLYFFISDDKEFPILDIKDEISRENIRLLIRILILVEHIYTSTIEYTTSAASSYSQEYIEEMQNVINSIDYSEYIRPDMLKLFNFVNDWKKIPQDEKVILKYGTKTLELNNYRNWIFTAVNGYLDEHLGVDNVEQGKGELQSNYSKKTGRKILNRYQSAVIYGVSSVCCQFANNTSVSNQLCRFIRDYLKYLEMPITDDDFEHDDQLSLIKAKIYDFRKKGGAPAWLDDDELDSFERRSFITSW